MPLRSVFFWITFVLGGFIYMCFSKGFNAWGCVAVLALLAGYYTIYSDWKKAKYARN